MLSDIIDGALESSIENSEQEEESQALQPAGEPAMTAVAKAGLIHLEVFPSQLLGNDIGKQAYTNIQLEAKADGWDNSLFYEA